MRKGERPPQTKKERKKIAAKKNSKKYAVYISRETVSQPIHLFGKEENLTSSLEEEDEEEEENRKVKEISSVFFLFFWNCGPSQKMFIFLFIS